MLQAAHHWGLLSTATAVLASRRHACAKLSSTLRSSSHCEHSTSSRHSDAVSGVWTVQAKGWTHVYKSASSGLRPCITKEHVLPANICVHHHYMLCLGRAQWTMASWSPLECQTKAASRRMLGASPRSCQSGAAPTAAGPGQTGWVPGHRRPGSAAGWACPAG